MANEFKIRKGLIVEGASGGTVVDVQGSQGQLFSVTDNLSGSIFAVSDISGVPILDVNSSGLVTLDGTLTSSGIITAPSFVSSTDTGININGITMTRVAANTAIRVSNGLETLGLLRSYAALVVGTAGSFGGDITISNAYPRFNLYSSDVGEDDYSIINNNGIFGVYNVTENQYFLSLAETTGNATFSAQAFSAATSSGDASSTLTTKGYVDGLITGATIYRGTWQAGISATSSGATTASTTLTVSAAILDAAGNTPVLVGAVVTGAGITGTVKVATVTSSTVYELDTAIDSTATAYIFSPIHGAPDLSGVTETSGYYYICSEAGSATPNGAGTEPNTWGVGDWVIWNDDVGSGEWQKVDNSSVLSGAGTGQTVALWEGPASVTDSETLGNAPITVSGNNTTFAGIVAAVGVSSNIASATSGTFATGTAIPANQIVHVRDNVGQVATNSAGGIKISSVPGNDVFLLKRNDGATSYFALQNSSAAEFITVNMASGNATFAGTVTSDDITIVDGSNDVNLYLANTSYGLQLDVSSGNMFFRTNGATRFTIENGGTAVFAGNATFVGKITAPKLSIQNQINTTSTNLEINYENGDGTTTNFKDFYVRDGKNAVILNIQGSSKNSTFAGNVTATANYTAGNSAIIYKAQRSGGAVAGDWSYDDATTDMSLGTSTAHSFSLKTGNTKALTINSSQNAAFTGGITATYGNYSSAVNALYFRTAAANTEYSLLTRDSTGNALFVQNAQSGTDQNIALFQYGSSTVNAGTTVLQVAKDKSYFANCNVGIGTTSPLTKLHIADTTDANIIRIENTATALSAGDTIGAIQFFNNDTTDDSPNVAASIYATAGASGGSGSLRFKTKEPGTEGDPATESMIITNGGNVGIGTNANGPTTPLHVIGITQIVTGSNTAFYEGASVRMFGSQSYTFRNSPGQTRAIINVETSGVNAGNLSLYNASTILTTKLNNAGDSYFNGGNVGIGTTSPSAALHVYDSSSGEVKFERVTGYSGLLHFGFPSGLPSIRTSGNFAIKASNTWGADFYINSSGNVGIGTSTPNAKLDIQGTQGQLFSVTDDLSGEIFAVADISGVPIMTVNSSGVSYFDGNVGIGTTSPSEKLQVDGAVKFGQNSNIPEAAISHYTNGYLYIKGGSSGLAIGNNDYNASIYLTNGDAVQISTSGSARMTINSSGNVGIGVTNPGQKLEINPNDGGDTRDIKTFFNTASVYNPAAAGTEEKVVSGLKFGWYSDYYQIGATRGGGTDVADFIISDTGQERLIIKANGNVGIGTTSPGYKLQVGDLANTSSVKNDIFITGDTVNFNGYYARLIFGNSSQSGGATASIRGERSNGSNYGTSLTFYTNTTASPGNGSERMRIDSEGNVGIGGNTPSYLLDVRKGTVSGAIARFNAINPHVIIESQTAGNSVLHFKPNVTSSKSGQFKVTAGNGYNFRWTNDAAGTGETAYMDLDTSTTGGGDLTVKGDVIAYGSPSDRKYKENIKPIKSALDKAMQLQGVTFDWKDSESILDIKEDIGFIAQDVEKVLPELVRDNGKGNLSLRYQGITPVLLEAIKELKAEIEELKKQIK